MHIEKQTAVLRCLSQVFVLPTASGIIYLLPLLLYAELDLQSSHFSFHLSPWLCCGTL